MLFNLKMETEIWPKDWKDFNTRHNSNSEVDLVLRTPSSKIIDKIKGRKNEGFEPKADFIRFLCILSSL